MMPGTLTRYFGKRFMVVVAGAFLGLFALILMVDFIELMRRFGDRSVSALTLAQVSLYRVPHITERIVPFTVLVGGMVCYLNLSRRLELVVARAAGMSAWQFVRPAAVIALLLGIAMTTVYNPVAATFRERSERLEAEIAGESRNPMRGEGSLWLRQRTEDGQSIINAASSRQQGAELSDVSVFVLDVSDRYLMRIEAKRATLQDGFWRLEDARVYSEETLPTTRPVMELKTNLTRAQIQETFATPETVPFWQLGTLITLAEQSGLAAVGYRLQYYQLLVLPLYLVSMVLLAAAVSLRLFRFGGVQKMVLGGVITGFLLYVLAKVAGDLSKASLLPPAVAAILPPALGGMMGFVALLYQEDG